MFLQLSEIQAVIIIVLVKEKINNLMKLNFTFVVLIILYFVL